MRLLAILPLALLLGAAPSAPAGTFQTWGVDPAKPLSMSRDGITVTVAARLCRTPAQNEGCRFDRVSNQALITVTRPGAPPFRMTSDPQASFVRVALVRFAPGAGHLGAVVDNQFGGSAGLTEVTVIEPVDGGFRAVPLTHDGSTQLTGSVTALPPGLSPDGMPGFVLEAPGFDYSGECTACTRGVPLVLSIRNGRSVDISADPAMRPLFARDLPAHRHVCVSSQRERNGNCAAFVADAARLGWVAFAWRVMLAHYRHEPAGYPAALRAFLVKEGYITPEAARMLPLA
jgi:hypothetical protein